MTDKLKPYIEVAAQIWCRPDCENKEMDTELAYAFAETMQKREDAMQRVVDAAREIDKYLMVSRREQIGSRSMLHKGLREALADLDAVGEGE